MSGFALIIGADCDRPTFAAMLHAVADRGGPAATMLRADLLAGVHPSPSPDAAFPGTSPGREQVASPGVDQVASPAGGATGTQPCCSPDGEWLLCFDGTLWDTDELAAELRKSGRATTGASQPELVLAALRQWGPDAVRRLSGEFALVLVHRPTGATYLARDALGVKPLYWCMHERRLHIASEIKALVPIGSRIRAVKPGHHGWAQPPDPPALTAWYELPQLTPAGPPPGEAEMEASAAALRLALSAAVSRRLPLDEPVGVLLTGDATSAAILLNAVEQHPDCVAFALGARGEPALAGIAELAQDLGVPVEIVQTHPRRIGYDQVREAVRVGELAGYADITAAVLALPLLARVHERGIRVLLAGEGGEELFGEAPSASAELRRYRLANLGRTGLQRLDRVSAMHGVCARVPYLDPGVIAVASGLAAPAEVLRHTYAPQLNGYRFVRPGATLEARIRLYRPGFSRLHRAFGYDLYEPVQRDLETVLAECGDDLHRALAERATRPDHTLAEHARDLAHTLRRRPVG
jgi:asparagine synthase (glutamine-hydrolysing)